MLLRALFLALPLSLSPCVLATEESEVPATDAETTTAETEQSTELDPPPTLPEPRWQRHNRQLANKLESETIWWLDPEQQVLALYQPEATGTPQGAVLLLAELGQHARWPGLQQALREELPWAGWHTLSIALPQATIKTPPEESTADSEPSSADAAQPATEEAGEAQDTEETQTNDSSSATSAEAPIELQLRAPLGSETTLEERREQLFALLDSAREQLKTKQIANQAVIAEGEALWWISYWLSERQPPEFGALIMLNPRTPPLEGAPRFNELLEKLKLKQQLDLILLPDDSLSASRQREAVARRQGQNYQRLTLSAMNAQQLAKRLYSWLNRHLPGMEQTVR